LKLKCDILVSKICFETQLVPLHSGGVFIWIMRRRAPTKDFKRVMEVGLHKLKSVQLTHSLK
jgi:hypothetical protein